MSTKAGWALRLLVVWITYLLVFSWLPLVRCVMDGATYRWGTAHFGRSFSAQGLEPDVWLLVAKSALLIFLLYSAQRAPGPLFRWLLILWSFTITADVVQSVIRNPSGFEFHGDTLGIHLNLGVVVPLVVGGFALLAFYWGWKNSTAEPPEPIPWTRRNRVLMTLVIALLPVQLVLLRFGEPHGTSDAVGVILTIAQCPLLAFALAPRRSPTEVSLSSDGSGSLGPSDAGDLAQN